MPAPVLLPEPPPLGPRLGAALLVTASAAACYAGTLLPGLDFGDTAAFQAAAGEWRLTPRQAYPLYFFLGNSLFALTGGEPAWSLNLTSALAGAVACGTLVWVASGLTGSVLAGASAGLLMAFSYTFWSQAIIAEVYTLHLLMTGLTLAAGLWWSRRPSAARLALVYGIYALGFGNHLMMLLLAPALVALIVVTPGGLSLALSPRGLALALACAAAGASQYLWNASYLWLVADPPPSLAEGLRDFWFDVTKSDWRATMVGAVHETALRRRLPMYWFDIRQQIGVPGVLLAAAGVVSLIGRWRVLLVLVAGYAASFVFAYTYNVGDVHVFFLPSHQFVVLAAGAGAAAVLRLAARARPAGLAAAAAAALLLALPAWRGWDTWPAVDRHADRRPQAWLDALTRGLGPDGLLLADVNWQLRNGLDYYTRHLRPELNVVSAADRVLALPALVSGNLAAGSEVTATPISSQVARAAYGGLFTFMRDPRVDARPLSARLSPEKGSIYVVALLAPYRDLPFDQEELTAALQTLTGGAASLAPARSYQVLAGLVGQAPVFDRRTDEPFRDAVVIGPAVIDIRMESWLPADTMRRAGFGHVVVQRRHALTLERGVSVLLLTRDGRVRQTAYASGLFAPLPRLLVQVRPGPPPP